MMSVPRGGDRTGCHSLIPSRQETATLRTSFYNVQIIEPPSIGGAITQSAFHKDFPVSHPCRHGHCKDSVQMKKRAKNVNAKVPVQPAVVVMDSVVQPTHAEIAKRAHKIYLARGGAHGCDLDDWLQAERELKAANRNAPR